MQIERGTTVKRRGIMTVLGFVDPRECGPVLAHEHVFCDAACNFVYTEEASSRAYLHQAVDIAVLGLLRRRPFSLMLDNVVLDDENVAIEEVRLFAHSGGNTLVDCTVTGLRPDPTALQRVSRATGVHIVQGTGLYVEPSHPDWVRDASIDSIADRFVRDVKEGIGATGVRAGIIGEIGTSGVRKSRRDYRRDGDITPDEEKVLRAAGRAAAETGLSVSVHLDVRGKGALRVMDILDEEGVSADRMIMGHLDCVDDMQYHVEVARRGAFVEFDSFGREYYADEIGVAWGWDYRRLAFIRNLAEAGHEDQLLMSQDVCLKMDLRRYGGSGYDHILRTVIPWMRQEGFDNELIEKLLIHNPRRALAFESEDQYEQLIPSR